MNIKIISTKKTYKEMRGREDHDQGEREEEDGGMMVAVLGCPKP